jgi:hypothetical protein
MVVMESLAQLLFQRFRDHLRLCNGFLLDGRRNDEKPLLKPSRFYSRTNLEPLLRLRVLDDKSILIKRHAENLS